MIDLHGFDLNLFDWLVWCNAERPHLSLKLRSHIRYVTERNKGKPGKHWADANALHLMHTDFMHKLRYIWHSLDNQGVCKSDALDTR